MKNYILIISILFFGYEIFASHISSDEISDRTHSINTCPPYHEKSGRTLLIFLTNDRFKENIQEIGIRITEEVIPKDIVLSEESGHISVCKKLNEQIRWPRDHFFTSYFKMNDHYIVVNALNTTQPEEEGKININTGYSSIFVFDNELKRVGQFLY